MKKNDNDISWILSDEDLLKVLSPLVRNQNDHPILPHYVKAVYNADNDLDIAISDYAALYHLGSILLVQKICQFLNKQKF